MKISSIPLRIQQTAFFIYHGFALYGLILIFGWIFDYSPVIALKEGTINKTTALIGETVIFTQPIEKFRDCPGEVDRFLSGPCGLYHIAREFTSLEKGSHDLIIPVEIPLSAQIGKCTFSSKYVYRCNPLDSILSRQSFYSKPIEFMVEKHP